MNSDDDDLDSFLKQLKEKANQAKTPSKKVGLASSIPINSFYTRKPIGTPWNSSKSSNDNIKDSLGLPTHRGKFEPFKKAQSPIPGHIDSVREEIPGKPQIGNQGNITQWSSSSEENFFSNKKFCFIPYGTWSTKKKIEIACDLAKKKGAKILSLEDLIEHDPKTVIIISSRDMDSVEVFKKFMIKNIPNTKDYLYIDCEWITKCAIEKKMVDHSPYCINLVQSIVDSSTKILAKTQSNEIICIESDELSEGIISKFGMKASKETKENLDQSKLEKDDIIWENDDDNTEYLTLKAISLLRKRMKLDQKNKKYIQNYYLYDYLYEIQPSIQCPFENQIKSEEVIKYEDIQRECKIINDYDAISEKKTKKQLYSTNEISYIKGSLSEDNEHFKEFHQNNDKKAKKVKNFKTEIPKNERSMDYWLDKKDTFLCQLGSAKNDMNSNIINELEKYLKIYTNEKDSGRMQAYRRAITIIKTQTKKIETKEDVENIPRIGKTKQAEILMNDQKTKCIEDLIRVWGIGAQTASDLYQKGIKGVDELRKNIHLLNKNQKIGLKYVEEFEQRIPREEVTKIVEFVKNKVEELSDIKGIYEVICCGSYRRGKPTCGDVDILITRKDEKSSAGFLQKIVKALEGILLTEHLALPSKPSPQGSESYMGVCCYEGGLHRRIDIKIYPREQFGYAVLYFTGSDWFNRSMRLWAKKLGYMLNDHGLYPSLRSENEKSEKIWIGKNIPCFSEEDVFRVLKLDYKSPSERDVGQANQKIQFSEEAIDKIVHI